MWQPHRTRLQVESPKDALHDPASTACELLEREICHQCRCGGARGHSYPGTLIAGLWYELGRGDCDQAARRVQSRHWRALWWLTESENSHWCDLGLRRGKGRHFPSSSVSLMIENISIIFVFRQWPLIACCFLRGRLFSARCSSVFDGLLGSAIRRGDDLGFHFRPRDKTEWQSQVGECPVRCDERIHSARLQRFCFPSPYPMSYGSSC